MFNDVLLTALCFPLLQRLCVLFCWWDPLVSYSPLLVVTVAFLMSCFCSVSTLYRRHFWLYIPSIPHDHAFFLHYWRLKTGHTYKLMSTILFLLMLSGDTEENPWPLSTSSTTSDCFSGSLSSLINSGLSGMHLNIQSLRPKLDILTIESQPYDRALVEPYCQRRRSSNSQFLPSLQTR